MRLYDALQKQTTRPVVTERLRRAVTEPVTKAVTESPNSVTPVTEPTDNIVTPKVGRPRVYSSGAERQAAYRARRASK